MVAGSRGSPDSGATTAISECQTLDESGHYELTTDLESDDSTCIEIQVANVTLDGNGHSITSTDGDGTGVRVRGPTSLRTTRRLRT